MCLKRGWFEGGTVLNQLERLWTNLVGFDMVYGTMLVDFCHNLLNSNSTGTLINCAATSPKQPQGLDPKRMQNLTWPVSWRNTCTQFHQVFPGLGARQVECCWTVGGAAQPVKKMFFKAIMCVCVRTCVIQYTVCLDAAGTGIHWAYPYEPNVLRC